MAPQQKVLQEELEVFERHKGQWVLEHLAAFVVISGTTVAGFFPDYESAFKEGLAKFGVRANFLVKQIWAEEPVYLIH